ncbi:6,7-dimethyl-8-ribityllumazine synthase [Fluoribacter dumoffii]|uniref:6,7-dimethyl-8-ribityllumazine synthase n=1 Tax=Fluoribacter dumoffii TaxID=463 RepID=A0A377G718_9GAMM|nr:6,7-dimethyl-8-ribityllumazine synthase [Fluoribacter dumoffii]KTC91671.1 riboflavin synthase beta chain (6,7-dimethyl-8-ribityllumazine synthase) [Fluoribacter dumoffii NY 23]MCW8387204.1 6,7-dimethyl-8-ribityllumazine synthase [Fluoribacter dumoffii]MCW8417291.1 6,7-dimethyl-8-ribityllumazine synthase [Fluoribacter dumoffii]MCW8454868.1 6,7-dimethyl-8-ribityllumazine synthase [Fluoribacter dumoffii]MCW8461055.1 6,7-dimethyl-8-ribityllumazine synthase [Fluoribacter dumoffii]
MQNTAIAEDTSLVSSFPIAIITSVFNRQVTKALQEGAIAQLLKRGFNESDIHSYEVPGAVEIPLIAKRLAMQKKVHSIITLGAVIRGETSHYDLVCNIVSQGCLQVALEYNIPVLFGVLTTDNEEQAWDRLGGKAGHKGIDVANAAISMQQTLSQL